MREDDEWLNMQSITFDLREDRIVQLEQIHAAYELGVFQGKRYQCKWTYLFYSYQATLSITPLMTMKKWKCS